MMLRDYQRKTIDDLYSWFDRHDSGHPCLVLPTGAGKSHIVAALCKEALQSWPETRVLMVTHQKELIEQNAAKLRQHWPNAPLGIYSASVGKRQLGEPITFAGIQSLIKRLRDIGHIDIALVDEAHIIGHDDEGNYRKLLRHLESVNPHIRIIGLTATPYRLGHGLITDPPALFSDLIEPVSIEELVFKGYLAPLRSKVTKMRLDTSGVKKRGGEYIERDLQRVVDTDPMNDGIVREVLELAGDRKAWLFFCAGVKHAERVRDVLRHHGVTAECVTGETPKAERARILEDFKAGKIRALTNANVLTTGFDHPDIDLIAMLRPTLSVSLYVQMAGRGMRPKSHTDHCLVLDFAGVVSMHGPITAVHPGGRRGDGEGEAMIPAKACETCHELVPVSTRVCPGCGTPFPEPEQKTLELHDDDIMGIEDTWEMHVNEWRWRKHTSRTSGIDMLAVTYYSTVLSDPGVTEYFPVLHDGYAGTKAVRVVAEIASRAGAHSGLLTQASLDLAASDLTRGRAPHKIRYQRDGKFFRVLRREWGDDEAKLSA